MKQYAGILFLVKIIFTISRVLSEPFPVERFEELLRQTQGNALSVQNTKWRHLTAPGENYGSMVLGIEVNILRGNNPETLQVVCKMPPRSKFIIEHFDLPLTFFKEMFFYTKTVPAFLELQKEFHIKSGSIIDFLPTHYGSRLSLNSDSDCPFDNQAAIVLENLHFSDYKNEDRLIGLDLKRMEYAVMGIAKLHATGIALKIKSPKVFDKQVEPGLIQKSGNKVDFAEKTIDKVIRVLEGNNEAKPYMNMIHKTLRYVPDMPASLEQWRTFVHNDYWVNNIMYRYDESGKIAGMKIIDFQQTVHDYGVRDLIFCLMTSAKDEVVDNYLDDLINLYYGFFTKTLKAFKICPEDFSRESFDQLLKKVAPATLWRSFMLVQMLKAPREIAPDVNTVTTQAELLAVGKGKAYEEKLLHIFRTFVRKNWLIE